MSLLNRARILVALFALSCLIWNSLIGKRAGAPLGAPEAAAPDAPSSHTTASAQPSAIGSGSSRATPTSAAATATSAYRCRHRHSRYAFRSPALSPKLRALLRRYNRLHDRQLRRLPVDDALRTPLTSRNNTVRYVLLNHVPKERTPENLATEMYSLCSAYLFALLTDRVLLVNNDEYERVMCEPFTRSSWKIVPGSNASSLLLALPSAELSSVVRSRRPARLVRLNLASNGDHRTAMQCAGNLREAFSHVQLISVDDTAGQFIDLLQANKAHDQHLWDLFPDGSILAPLYNALVHPANVLWQDLPELLRSFSDSTIERPWKVSAIGDVLAAEAFGAVERASQELLHLADRTVALLLSPSDLDVVNEGINVYATPKYLVAASAAHFHHPDSTEHRYGRFFADMFLAAHSDLLVFDTSRQDGWLAHALRSSPAVAYSGTSSEYSTLPAIDYEPVSELQCPNADH